MESLLLHTLSVFMGFFAIMNPIANAPVFIGLTSGDNRDTKKAVALRSVVLAFLIVVIFCFAGKTIFHLFGITLPAFRITGGLLVFFIGYHMLQGEQSTVHNPSEEDNQRSIEAELSVAVSPLAMPILAGPGTIATAMNFAAKEGSHELVITISAFAILCLITYILFLSGEKFVTYVGESAVKVITRMMGLILAVIGTQMVIHGIRGAVQFSI